MLDAHLRLELPGGPVRQAPRGAWTHWATSDRAEALHLAEAAAALRYLTRGRLLLDDFDLCSHSLDELARWRSSCVCLCRLSALDPRQSPQQLVRQALAGRGLPRRDRRDRASSILEQQGLERLRSRPLGRLGPAARCRTWLARAMAQQPELVILHDPEWRPAARALRGLLRREGAPEPTVLELGPGRRPEGDSGADRGPA